MPHLLWKKLTALAQLDNTIQNLVLQTARHELFAQDCQTKLEQSGVNLEEELAREQKLKKNIHTIDLAIQGIDAEQKKKKQHLSLLSHEKERIALFKEIDGLEAQYQKYEDQLLEAWSALEQYQKKCSIKKNEIEQQRLALVELLTTTRASKETLKGEEVVLMLNRAELIQTIAPAFLEVYESMKYKVTDPIVMIAHESCGACYYPLLPQDLSRAKKNAIITCLNCSRLLYYSAPTLQPTL